MINITFPDGSVRAFEKGVTGYEIAKSIYRKALIKAFED